MRESERGRVIERESKQTIRSIYKPSSLFTCSVGETSLAVPADLIPASSPSSMEMFLMRVRWCSKIISRARTSSLNHTIPQRLTVARVAYFRSCTSNMMRTCRSVHTTWIIRTYVHGHHAHTCTHTYTCTQQQQLCALVRIFFGNYRQE